MTRTARTPETDHAAARLALHRIATSLHVDTIAGVLGVSRAALYRYERGDVVKVATVKLIAELFDMTVTEVMAPFTRAELDAALKLGKPGHEVLTWFGLLEAAR